MVILARIPRGLPSHVDIAKPQYSADVDTVTLIASKGRPIKKVSRVTFDNGKQVTFTELMSKHEAIAQAEELLRRDPNYNETVRRYREPVSEPVQQQKELSQIQATIANQLKALNPDFISHWNVKAIFGINEEGKEGIQVSTNDHGRVVNYQIFYESGQDTYQVKAFKMDPKTFDVQEVYSASGLYGDNLFSAMQSGDENARVGLKVTIPKTNTPLIWRWSIGHYGGYYVDVPAENFGAFKAMFQRGTFPRKAEEESVAERVGDSATEIRFDKTFPKSRGRYYAIYFADRSKGEQILEHSNVMQTSSAEKPDLSD